MSNDIQVESIPFVHEQFEAQVKRTPNLLAVETDEKQLTYQALNQWANRLARHLKSLGIGPESRVGICMERCPEVLIAMLAVFKAGGAYVPLDPNYPADRLAFMIQDTQIPVLLTQSHLTSRITEPVPEVIALDLNGDRFDQYDDNDFPTDAALNNLAYIIYTSGSSGLPKGVMIEHRSVAIYTPTITKIFKLDPGDKKMQSASISFDVSVSEIYTALTQGATIVFRTDDMLSFDVYLQKCEAWSLKQIGMSTAFWHELTDRLVAGTVSLPLSVRAVAIGDEKALPERLKIWKKHVDPEIQVRNGYGPTETTINACFCIVAGPSACEIRADGEVPIGKPLPGVQAYILDEHLQQVPDGESGELHIGGFGLARGYLNQPELTAEKFIQNPYSDTPGERLYKTGDRVRYLPDGNIEFLGRIDHQIKIRGYRIEPGEIEAAISEMVSVKHCVVVAREDTPGNKRLAAYMVLASDTHSLDRQDLRKALKERLATYMIPSAFVVLEKLPSTPNGKLDRKSLPPPISSDYGLDDHKAGARDDLERQLIDMWEQMLQLKPIGIEDNFFDLGGHSLLAVDFFKKIERTTGKILPLSTLFQAPTIEQLAEILRHQEEKVRPATALVPIQPHGTRSPFFCVHGHLGNVLNFVDLSRHLGDDQPFYGLQSIGLIKGQVPITHIEDMARVYIEEMQTVQPEGPYYLGGYCFGGLVAIEMANQLLAQGEEIAFLGLFDVVPDMFSGSISADAIQRYKKYEEGYGIQRYLVQMKEKTNFQRFQYLTNGFIRRVKIRMHSALWRTIKGRDKTLSRLFHNVESTNLLALRMYDYEPYPGDMTLFLSKDISEACGFDDPVSIWSGLATGQTEICLISDGGAPDLGRMFLEPSVNELAGKLDQCIQRASVPSISNGETKEIMTSLPVRTSRTESKKS